jgi:hypothetical protein
MSDRVRFRKDILPIAGPILLGLLVFQIQTLTNRAFLGRLDVSLLSVISNVVFPLWTMTAMLNALSTGAAMLMSHALGSGDVRRAGALAGATLLGALLVRSNRVPAQPSLARGAHGDAVGIRCRGTDGNPHEPLGPRTRGSHDRASGGRGPFRGTGARVRRGTALLDRRIHAGRRHHHARRADPARIVLHILSPLC